MTLRVGFDLLDVSEVHDAIARFGDRYLRRVYTPAEIACCRDGSDVRGLAGCFAAKEATFKLLADDVGSLDLRSVEVRRGPGPTTVVALSGAATDLAREACIVRISVSIGMAHGLVSALALAERLGDDVGGAMEERIRVVIDEVAGLSVPAAALGRDDDLFAAGMTSHASVSVMLALEDEFGVEFPDRLFSRSVFSSIGSLAAAISELGGEVAA